MMRMKKDGRNLRLLQNAYGEVDSRSHRHRIGGRCFVVACSAERVASVPYVCMSQGDAGA